MSKLSIAILIGCLISSNIVNADSSRDGRGEYPDDLKVDIMNTGSDNCVLIKQVLLKGALYQSTLPLILPATADRRYFTLTGNNETNLELTYQCGMYKKITLHMRQYKKPKHIHTSIEAYAFNAVDVYETHTSKETFHNRDGGYRESGHKYPGTLSWHLHN